MLLFISSKRGSGFIVGNKIFAGVIHVACRIFFYSLCISNFVIVMYAHMFFLTHSPNLSCNEFSYITHYILRAYGALKSYLES